MFTAEANGTQAVRTAVFTVTAGTGGNTASATVRFEQEPLPPAVTNAFVYTIRTTQPAQEVPLPTMGTADAEVTITIDYGDGSEVQTVTESLSAAMKHAYAQAGDYQVTIVTENRIDAFSMAKHKELIAVDDNQTDWSSVTTLKQAFNQCSALETIPENLFSTCTLVTDASSVFRDCKALREAPAHLFAGCAACTTFEYAFRGCTALERIGQGLFSGCVKVSYFDGCFIDCGQLKAIPEGLFDDCTEARGFNYTFQNNASLTAIPSGLFDHCKNITGLDFCFSRCTSLTGESPYTMHGEIKIHLYERERYSDLYPTPPMTAMACFMECRGLTDAAYIALNYPDWINY